MYTHVIDMHEETPGMSSRYVIEQIKGRIIRESFSIERAVKDDSVVVKNTKDVHFGVQTVRSSFNSEWLLE